MQVAKTCLKSLSFDIDCIWAFEVSCHTAS